MRWKLARRGTQALLGACLLTMCSGPLEPSDLIGTWGGDHVEVAFDSTGVGVIQYDCAHGRITPPIVLSAGGELAAAGEHVREHGGPVREGEAEDRHPAQYRGVVRGDRLTFTVTLADSETVLGPYTVRRGEQSRLLRCL